MISLNKVKIKGSVLTASELDKLINVSDGDAYITSDGHLHVYTKSSWVNAGVIKCHKSDNKIYK